MNLFYTLILLVILVALIYGLLVYIDLKIDYSHREIRYYFYADNGFYIRVPYFIWQINKQRAIEKLFSETIVYEGKEYIVSAIFKDKPHLDNGTDLLPAFLYRDYMATVEFRSFMNNITNINQIIGDNNTVNNISINQPKVQNISNSIDALLQSDIDDTYKQCLELFKLKLNQNSVTDRDKNSALSVLEKLTKYAPYASLASSIINLIKSVLP